MRFGRKGIEHSSDGQLPKNAIQLDIQLGCNGCPEKKIVHCIGEKAVRFPSYEFPSGYTTSLNDVIIGTVSKVEIGHGNCDEGEKTYCTYVDEINDAFQKISANPTLLDDNFNM